MSEFGEIPSDMKVLINSGLRIISTFGYFVDLFARDFDDPLTLRGDWFHQN